MLAGQLGQADPAGRIVVEQPEGPERGDEDGGGPLGEVEAPPEFLERQRAVGQVVEDPEMSDGRRQQLGPVVAPEDLEDRGRVEFGRTSGRGGVIAASPSRDQFFGLRTSTVRGDARRNVAAGSPVAGESNATRIRVPPGLSVRRASSVGPSVASAAVGAADGRRGRATLAPLRYTRAGPRVEP